MSYYDEDCNSCRTRGDACPVHGTPVLTPALWPPPHWKNMDNNGVYNYEKGEKPKRRD